MKFDKKIKASVITTLFIALSFSSDAQTNAPSRLKPPTSSDASAKTVNEAGWRDDRWNQMDVGPFVNSSVRLPHGAIAKGFSIRVGDNNEAAVCYDTALCNLRAAWNGGLIQFAPERFGLINMPRPAGELLFSADANENWLEAAPHFRGFFVHGKRVVLSYDVSGMSVSETPWLEVFEKTSCITRTLETGPHPQTRTLNLVELKSGLAIAQEIEGVKLITLTAKEVMVAAAIAGDSTASLLPKADRINLQFSPGKKAATCKVMIWSGKTNDLQAFAALVKKCKPAGKLAPLTKPGPKRWGEPIVTKGELAAPSSEPYVVDTISVPYENPFRAMMFLSGVDFFENGDAAVCSMHGDVWKVSGLDPSLQKIKWQRLATGLFQPLGLKIVKDKVYVLGRDQITRLHDNNRDGEADYYENFCNEIKTSVGGHDYVTALERDANGNFYHVDPFGVHRVSADGKKYETLATGFRNPNGMGVSPDGIITVTPQEGEWTPSSAVCEIKPGGFYGKGGPQISADRPLGYDPPLCWMPRLIDNSSGSQVWVTSDRWGPLKNQMLTLSFGRCAMLLVLREAVDGIAQGGVVPLKPRFLSGSMRGTFRKNDGQLYVVGATGWQTSATREGCFQRVRYTGKTVCLPTTLHIFENGIELTFSEPLERETAADTGSYGIEQWNYIYSNDYGSKEYSVSQPSEVGHDPVDVKTATLSADGKTVFLEIDGLAPVMQMQIQFNLNSADGKTVKGEIYNTIHRLAQSSAKKNSTGGGK